MGQVDTVYASALFELAKEDNKLEEINEEIQSLYDIFKSETELREVLETPVISSKEKKDLVKTVFEGRLSKDLYNFLNLLVDKNRMRQFMGISESFFDLYREDSNITLAEVYTVESLSDDILEALQAKLSQVTGKRIEIKQIVDDTIIGGLKIKIGSKLLDSSVLNKLKDLGESLRDVSL
ncbi:MAG: F0F1 ATP synthase subunit delta [Bacillota bacterium]|nr:F0F1 ATP synthase subunit delta [Bacillota bacterium]